MADGRADAIGGQRDLGEPVTTGVARRGQLGAGRLRVVRQPPVQVATSLHAGRHDRGGCRARRVVRGQAPPVHGHGHRTPDTGVVEGWLRRVEAEHLDDHLVGLAQLRSEGRVVADPGGIERRDPRPVHGPVLEDVHFAAAAQVGHHADTLQRRRARPVGGVGAQPELPRLAPRGHVGARRREGHVATRTAGQVVHRLGYHRQGGHGGHGREVGGRPRQIDAERAAVGLDAHGLRRSLPAGIGGGTLDVIEQARQGARPCRVQHAQPGAAHVGSVERRAIAERQALPEREDDPPTLLRDRPGLGQGRAQGGARIQHGEPLEDLREQLRRLGVGDGRGIPREWRGCGDDDVGVRRDAAAPPRQVRA